MSAGNFACNAASTVWAGIATLSAANAVVESIENNAAASAVVRRNFLAIICISSVGRWSECCAMKNEINRLLLTPSLVLITPGSYFCSVAGAASEFFATRVPWCGDAMFALAQIVEDRTAPRLSVKTYRYAAAGDQTDDFPVPAVPCGRVPAGLSVARQRPAQALQPHGQSPRLTGQPPCCYQCCAHRIRRPPPHTPCFPALGR